MIKFLQRNETTFIVMLYLLICSSFYVWAAQVAVISTDTREGAWAKETLNNSDLQTNIDGKVSTTGTETVGGLKNFNDGVSVGLAETTLGNVKWYTNVASNTFSFNIFSSTFTEDHGWRVPTAYPLANGYYITVDTDGTMNYIAPPSGSGDVTAAAVITDHSIVRGDGGAKGVQDSGILINDTDDISGVNDLAIGGDLTVTGTIGAGSNTDPTYTSTDSDTANGTSKFVGASSGAFDIIMSFWVDLAGTATEFMQIDGVSETIDMLYPTVLQTGDVINTELNADAKYDAIEFVIDGGGSAITTGVKGFLEVPYACTINSSTLLADQSGSIVVDIWVDTYANYPPTDADTITSSTPPTITTAVKSQDTTLTTWTLALSKGDIIGFNVDSITTVERVTLSLKVDK